MAPLPLRHIDPQTLLRLIEETSTVTWAVGEDGLLVTSDDWTRLTGQSMEEAYGLGWIRMLHPDDRARVEAAWETAKAHQSHYNTDYRILCRDGIYRWFNARGIPILNREGAATGWVGFIFEVAGKWRYENSQPANHELPKSETESYRDITPNALRAARGLLGWSGGDLASQTGMSLSTIRRLESDTGNIRSRKSNLGKILETFQSHGVRYIAKDGVVEGVTMDTSLMSKTQIDDEAFRDMPGEGGLQ